MEAQMERVVKLYDAMSSLSSMEDIHRVVVVKIENSGGLIDPKVQLYASVLHEDYTFPVTASKAKYQKLPIDQVYVRMLHSAIRDHRVHLDVANMEDGIMKTVYTTSGVKAAEIYYLGATPRVLYVLSVVSVTDGNVFNTPEYRLNCTMALEAIKKSLWSVRN